MADVNQASQEMAEVIAQVSDDLRRFGRVTEDTQAALAAGSFRRAKELDKASALTAGALGNLAGAGLAAGGVGNVFGSFLQGALRNPAAADGQQGRLFIGFAAAELLGLLAFVVAMILIFVA